MAAHVYWRLYITATASDGYAGLAAWVPKDSGGSTIATTGGTASASTAYGGQPASNAFDGNASTFWLTNGAGAPHWIQYQFASAVDIASFDLTNPSGGNDPHCVMDFQLQYSDNGSTWTTLYSYAGVGFGVSGQNTLTFNAGNALPTLIIAWRLSITAVAAGSGTCRIAQLKFFDAGSTQIPTSMFSASATSSYDGHNCPWLAFDGSASTYWNSNGSPSGGSPQNLAYTFGSSVSVASISIQADDYTRAPSGFSLQYSTDGSTWITSATYTSAAWTSNGQIQTFTIPAISSVSPSSAAQGAGVTLTVTGIGTHFVSGTTTVGFSGSGVTVGTITVASSTSLTVAITITSGAATGARTMTVTTGSEAPTATFMITAGVFERGHIDYDQVKAAVRQGAGTKFQMFGSGTPTSGHVAIYDANGNVVDGGAPSSVGTLKLETPSGTINGSNKVFTLTSTPATPLLLFLNGALQLAGTDFTISSGTITYTAAPISGDWHLAYYS